MPTDKERLEQVLADASKRQRNDPAVRAIVLGLNRLLHTHSESFQMCVVVTALDRLEQLCTELKKGPALAPLCELKAPSDEYDLKALEIACVAVIFHEQATKQNLSFRTAPLLYDRIAAAAQQIKAAVA